ncbi:MAG: GNAT family N-acetyltransferase [bacterium]|nr:GNAT family N-acetyltransferase [bacterium]
MKHLKLVLPCRKYLSSYLSALQEFSHEGKPIADVRVDLLKKAKDFPTYIKRISDDRQGKNLDANWVPATLFWAVLGDKAIGRLHLRHCLPKHGGHIGYAIKPSERGKGFAKKMLNLGLKKAKQIGIKKVYITCDKDNLASKAVIKANGGLLAKKYTKNRVKRLAFWIAIAK